MPGQPSPVRNPVSEFRGASACK